MSSAFWVLVVLVVVVAAAVVAFLVPRARQRRKLRERFGPEYERAVAEEGDRRSAERRLATAVKRRESLDIRPLSEHDQQSFIARWNEIQADFVDQPVFAADRADKLIVEVMRACGYPIEDFEDFEARTDLLAADHPRVVENYREAHALWKRNREPGAAADTEELRAALVRYRTLFERLLGPDASQDSAGYVDLGPDRGADRASSDRREESDVRSQEALPGSARGRADRSHSS